MSKVGMSKLMSSFVDKYRNWQKIVRQNNGIVGTFLMLFRLVRLCVGYGCRVVEMFNCIVDTVED